MTRYSPWKAVAILVSLALALGDDDCLPDAQNLQMLQLDTSIDEKKDRQA